MIRALLLALQAPWLCHSILPAITQTTGSVQPPASNYKGQYKQDQWVDQHIFKGKRGGVFVDLGCFDGVTGSNTWYFEKQLNWTGVCCEPDPGNHGLIRSRAGRMTGVHVAASDADGQVTFHTGGMRGSINSLQQEDKDVLRKANMVSRDISVQAMTPASLLQKHLSSKKVIDYVNIDVEGKEVALVRSWPFDSVCTEVFNIENNYNPSKGLHHSILAELKAVLEPRGYKHKATCNGQLTSAAQDKVGCSETPQDMGGDEIFVRTQACGGVEKTKVAVKKE